MSDQLIREIRFEKLEADYLPFLDGGGILHVTGFPGGDSFLEVFRRECAADDISNRGDWDAIFLDRKISDFKYLAAATKILKKLVHNHAFSMALLPLIERIGCALGKTHIDCGVIRYQLANNLRVGAETSGRFESEDFVRTNPNSIPEIFGYSKLPPHRDVRWPHIRILGGWMPLTDLDEGEALTLFPEVFDKPKALTDPNITPFPNVRNPNQFGLGKPFSPSMKAGDLLLFHALTVHSSPVHQSAPFRGSIDFRIAYPCIDDFAHYKWTFVQAKNLINTNSRSSNVSMHLQREALSSFAAELFQNSGLKKTVHEIRLSHESQKKVFGTAVIALILLGHFCPDTYLKVFNNTVRLGQRMLLTSILIRSDSYFWLYKSYLASRNNGFPLLAKLLRSRAVSAAKKTSLPIKNAPISWPGEPRELLPEKILEEFKKGR